MTPRDASESCDLLVGVGMRRWHDDPPLVVKRSSAEMSPPISAGLQQGAGVNSDVRDEAGQLSKTPRCSIFEQLERAASRAPAA